VTGALRSDVCGGTPAGRARATGRATDGGAATRRFPSQTSARQTFIFFGRIIILVISSYTLFFLLLLLLLLLLCYHRPYYHHQLTIRGLQTGRGGEDVVKGANDYFFPRQLSLSTYIPRIYFNFFSPIFCREFTRPRRIEAPPTWQ